MRIDSEGLTVRGWPHQTVRLPLAQVDRFDAVREVHWVGGGGCGVAGIEVERLVVITVDGKELPVSRAAKRHVCGWTLPAAACAQRLNNRLVDRRRPPSSSDTDSASGPHG